MAGQKELLAHKTGLFFANSAILIVSMVPGPIFTQDQTQFFEGSARLRSLQKPQKRCTQHILPKSGSAGPLETSNTVPDEIEASGPSRIHLSAGLAAPKKKDLQNMDVPDRQKFDFAGKAEWLQNATNQGTFSSFQAICSKKDSCQTGLREKNADFT